MKKSKALKKVLAASLSAALSASYVPMSVLSADQNAPDPAISDTTVSATAAPTTTAAPETTKRPAESVQTSEATSKVTSATTAAPPKKTTAATTAATTKKTAPGTTAATSKSGGKTTSTTANQASQETTETTTAVPKRTDHKMTVELAGAIGECSVDINGASTGETVYNNNNVEVNIHYPEGEMEDYIIDSIEINKQNYDINKVSDHGNNMKTLYYTVSEDDPENINVVITLKHQYTAKIVFDKDKGTVYDEDDTQKRAIAGELVYWSNDEKKIIAAPKEKYYVSKIVIDNEELDLEDLDTEEENIRNYIIDLDETKDQTINVTFETITYNVNTEGIKNGKVKINNKVVIDEFVDGTITPDDGYYIKSVTINGQTLKANEELINEDNDFTADYGKDGTFRISKVKTDIDIDVKFEAVPALDIKSLTIEPGTNTIMYAHDEENSKYFYFSKGGSANIRRGSAGIIAYDKEGKVIAGDEKVSPAVVVGSNDIYSIAAFFSENEYGFPVKHTLDMSTSPMRIVMTEPVSIKLTPPELPEGRTVYGHLNDAGKPEKIDIAVDIKAFEGNKVNSLEYWFDNKDDDSKKITVDGSSKSIKIDPAEHKGEHVKLFVRAVDEYGTRPVQELDLCINPDRPVVKSVTASGNKKDGAKYGYYSTNRVVTVVFNEPNYSWNPSVDMFEIIKDKKTLTTEEKKKMIAFNNKETGNTHTALINFTENGTYTINIKCVNKAGNTNDGVPKPTDNSEYSFTIYKITDDNIKQYGLKTTGASPWHDIAETITFGYFSEKIKVTPVYPSLPEGMKDLKIAYYVEHFEDTPEQYKLTRNKEEKVKELEKLYSDGKFTLDTNDLTSGITIDSNQKAIVYARIQDNAGDVIFVSTDGLISDNRNIEAVEAEFKGQSFEDENGNPIFTGDIPVHITVNDTALEEEAYSGIKSISYYIKQGKNTISGTEHIHDWDSKNKNAKIDKSIDKIFTLPALEDYNEDNLELDIIAYDNAGHHFTKPIFFSLNTDEADVTIDFNENSPTNDSYFRSRTAKVTIFAGDHEHRKDDPYFDEESANSALKALFKCTDANGKEIENAVKVSKWTANGRYHTATLTFENDGIYTCTNSKTFPYTNTLGNGVAKDGFKINGKAKNKFIVDSAAPTGKITIEDNTWHDIIDTITFGIFRSTKEKEGFNVEISANDNIEVTKVSYFVTDESEVYTIDKLKNLDPAKWQTIFNVSDGRNEIPSFKLTEPDKYVVYAKIEDAAQNVRYMCSDGHIIDNDASELKVDMTAPLLTRKDGDIEYNVYNSTFDKVDFKINCKENAKTNSGIKSIKYQIKSTDANAPLPNQDKEIVLYENKDPLKPDYEIEKSITLNTADYNRSDLMVYIVTEDLAGNKNEETKYLDIDVTAPVVELKYINDDINSISYDDKGNSYFRSGRTAEITITERSKHFDEEAAKNSIKIEAHNIKGDNLDDRVPKIENWTCVPDPNSPDGTKYIATISFSQNAIYSLSIDYSDTVQNKCESVICTPDNITPYGFTIDNEAPNARIETRTNEGGFASSDNLKDRIIFTQLSRNSINAEIKCEDDYSPVKEVSYIESHDTRAYSREELEARTDWQKGESLRLTPNRQSVIYAKIVDMAGNTKYVGTDGLIVDDAIPDGEFVAPVISLEANNNNGTIFNNDVTVKVRVKDPVNGDSFSGLQNIEYYITNLGGVSVDTTNVFSYNQVAPERDQLKKEFEFDIPVSAVNNNSNDVKVFVTATDRAGNTAYKELPLKIDITEPKMTVDYTEDKNTNSGENYFKSRSATITINERNFDPDNVDVTITRNGTPISVDLNWQQGQSVSSAANGDGIVHKATIPFNGDGRYSYNVSFKDMAGNTCASVGDSDFYIDNTFPVVKVTHSSSDGSGDSNNDKNKSNNNSGNGSYYPNGREIVFTVEEQNFNPNNVKLTVTRTLDGKKQEAPVASEWQNEGGVHKSKIKFDEDGDYTYDFKITDNAGNTSKESTESGSFTVDRTAPVLEMTINGKKIVKDQMGAYSDKIMPIIRYSDLNLDPNSISVSLTAANVEVGKPVIDAEKIVFTIKSKGGKETKWSGKIEDVLSDNNNVIGKKIIMDNFPEGSSMKEFDDIYTFSVAVKDKALNTASEKMIFSVNRYGSTYDISEVEDMLGKYIKEPKDIKITEYNPNKLKDIKITVFKDSESRVLEEGTDYTVKSDGGSGNWYKYTYNIPKSNFKDNGVYRVSVRSTDSAENVSENTLETKDKDVSFGVDSEEPNIIIANIENGETYPETEKDVVFKVSDNLMVDEVSVYVDGKDKVYTWSSEEIEQILAGDGEFHVSIPGTSSKPHSLKVVCKDKAGNESEQTIKNFYVTTNLAVRFLHNKGILFGAGGLLAVIAGAIVVFIKKKRS